MSAAFVTEWLNLLFRWAHLVVGVGWIGTSFYFIALDLSLRKRLNMKDGVSGTAWEVHGGGFYHVEKYMVAPKELPDDLIWYKWEAYLTWVTGFALLIVQYYLNASVYLIDPTKVLMAPSEAVLMSMASLGLGWILYDQLCKSAIGRNVYVLAIGVICLILGASYMFGQVFSGRGAMIHVGAFIGTIMAVNVFGVIIPNQKKITASLLKGETPDPALGAIGKQRSVHNNYLTLPVLLMMVSNHYPLLTGHPYPVLVVGLILTIGAMVRHFLNRHDAGDPLARYLWSLPVAAAALVTALIVTAPSTEPLTSPPQTSSESVTDAQVMTIVRSHCVMCHSSTPTHDGFENAPKNITLDTLTELRRFAPLVKQQAVVSEAMPLGNETGMTPQQRAVLGGWIERR